jgi:hypothetical protein
MVTDGKLAGMNTLTKKQYLQAMGIEVWSLRQSHSPESPGVSEKGAARQRQPARADSRKVQHQPAPKIAIDSEPRIPASIDLPVFQLAFLHYQSIGFCISLPKGVEGVPRRFCDDIARVAGGDIKAAKHHQLNWPMLNNSSIDQSLKAAKEVVAQKFGLLPKTVFVFGEDIRGYFDGIADLEIGSGRTVRGQEMFLFTSISQLMDSSNHKKSLWQFLVSRQNL